MNSREIMDTTPPPANFRINYGQNEFQFGDLRLPEKDGPHPVVVFVHGGFWRSLYSLDYAGHPCAELTAAGVATWNIEYRRLGNEGGGWPNTLLDVAQAVDFLREIALEYKLDLSRVVVTGHSAGGHLAAWLAARQRIPIGDPLYTPNPLSLRGAVPLAGVVNLRQSWEMQLSNNVTEELMGGTPEDLPERYETASPYELLPLFVPQVLIHGTDDESVPYKISVDYNNSASALGDDTRLITLPGGDHFGLVDPRTPEWKLVLEAILGLL